MNVTCSRTRLAILTLASLAAGVACQSKVVTLVDSNTTTATHGETTMSTGSEDPTGDGDPVDSCVSALDILVVLDNSGSMGEEQAALVSALPTMLDTLDQHAVDWRIGVTTSDNGNPWCPPGATTPEAGKLVASSCKQRLGDFLFNNDEVDMRDVACNDVCALGSVELLPTATEFDPNAAARPWVESIAGQANVADPLAALRCMLPMGVNGCGFESQLEASYLALIRAQDSNEDNYGFLRSDASLLVLIVSDEADCSYNKDWSGIFEADGNKAFWSDPAAAFPTSAVCWNAGVSCTGDPSGYDSCAAVNKGVDGTAGVEDADAVLYPVSRYDGLLAGLEQQKQALDPGASVRLALIAGTNPDGSVSYADAEDPGYQNSFGIGPGCTAGTLEAVPPVRMRDVAEQSGGPLTSICANDLSANLEAALAPFFGDC